jgi:hypothetical protein
MIFIVDTNRIYNQGFAIAETISTDWTPCHGMISASGGWCWNFWHSLSQFEITLEMSSWGIPRISSGTTLFKRNCGRAIEALLPTVSLALRQLFVMAFETRGHVTFGFRIIRPSGFA